MSRGGRGGMAPRNGGANLRAAWGGLACSSPEAVRRGKPLKVMYTPRDASLESVRGAAENRAAQGAGRLL